jgi:hypothetical protein
MKFVAQLLWPGCIDPASIDEAGIAGFVRAERRRVPRPRCLRISLAPLRLWPEDPSAPGPLPPYQRHPFIATLFVADDVFESLIQRLHTKPTTQ